MMKKRAFLIALAFLYPCYAEVEVFPNPAQQFNPTDNYCERLMYLFIQREFDGSITLQMQPPPFYDSDAETLASGVAYFDIDTTIQTYSAEEAASLGEVEITVTVNAIPNTTATTGYTLSAILLDWFVDTHIKAPTLLDMQSFNLIGYSEDELNAVNINPEDGAEILWFTNVGNEVWFSAQQGTYLTDSLIEPIYYSTKTPKTEYARDFTFKIDISSVTANNAPGNYTFYLLYQMQPLDPDQSLLDEMLYYGRAQQTQINALYDLILAIDSELDFGQNELYRPSDVEIVFLDNNRTELITQFDEILDAMTVQWNAYAALGGRLSVDERTVVEEMLAYIALATTELNSF